MSVQTILLAVLAILTVIYLIVFVRDLIKHKNDSEKGTNFIVMSVIGFVMYSVSVPLLPERHL